MSNTEKIAEILYELDPEGLASLGAPQDEYKNEARMLTERLKGKEAPEEIAQHLVDIFDQQFNFASKLGENEPSSRWRENRYKVEDLLSVGQKIAELR